MSVAPDILRRRQRRQASSHKNHVGYLAFGCSLIISLFIALTGTTFAIVYTNLTADLPSLDSLPGLLEPPDGLLLQPTTLYDSSGQNEILKLENPAAVGRPYLTLDQSQINFLPSTLISATITTSDPQFWHHAGFSAEDLNPNSHPTLAQRLVSELLLWEESPDLRRSFRERLLAAQITEKYGREQILTWYLNNANYGRLNYGADAAARSYFGVPASELNLSQAAVLAAVAEAPVLNPSDAPQAAVERSREVIHSMLAQGLIDEEQATTAIKDVPNFQTQSVNGHNLAPAFVNLVLEQLGEQFNLERIKRGGLKIITTLDYDLQNQANCTTAAYIARITQSIDSPGDADSNDCQAALLLPTSPPRTGDNPQTLSGNLIIIDPRNGKVLSMVGEITPGFDPAQPPGHTLGTLWTPFIYLTGFTRGLSPASLLWDIPTGPQEFVDLNGTYKGPVSLRTAMANDYPAPAMQVLTQVGAENVSRTARLFSFGSDTTTDNTGTSFLEDVEVTLLDVSRAFGVFANNGTLSGEVNNTPNLPDDESPILPVTVQKIEDFNGDVWFDGNPPKHLPVITPQLAYLVNNILADEPARWPTLGHPNPLEIGQPVATKLGSVASEKEAWTIGYTPNLVIGVWIGSGDGIQGPKVLPTEAAPLWHAIMKYASQKDQTNTWEIPAGISQIAVCDPSGMLPTEDCPMVVDEIFLSGNEPTQPDTLYQRRQINRETGLLATVFTPPELVEDQVYLLVPPEAADWARQAGLPTPPESHDIISTESTTSPEVNISSPKMFDFVRGILQIEGTAAGNGFEYYRLQVGQGLNPNEWFQLGQDETEPIKEDTLGKWDTGQTNGLYALQLLVVYQDQKVEVATIQVTVDNQSPDVQFIYPENGQIFKPDEGIITVRVEARDNLELAGVDFFLDGVLIKKVSQAPFVAPVNIKSGAHTLRVEAYDKAGNRTDQSIRISVER